MELTQEIFELIFPKFPNSNSNSNSNYKLQIMGSSRVLLSLGTFATSGPEPSV
jgi:hypothetical protein